MTEFTYVYDLGEYYGRTYQIGVRADPNLADVDSFAVVLFFERADGKRIEVAKIDDAEHEEGEIHLDRYYRREGADRKDFEIDVDSVFEAEDYFDERWRHHARTYQENHGTRSVT